VIGELAEAIRQRRAILFVGAGVSNCLGLPTWPQLVDHLAVELGFDPEIFGTHGDHLLLAEYYRLERGSIGPLRTWMDKAWHTGVVIGQSEPHKLIVDLDFPLIYTTNYDNWLEEAYKFHGRPYWKIANVGDLVRLRSNATQIVKFHGDFADDESIVLTESSYFDRLDFESPLDVKLRADLLGRSVLFIGYSLQDINIRYMLYKLHKQWSATSYPGLRPKSFVFLVRPNPVQQRVLESRGIHAIVSNSDDPKAGLTEFLSSLRKV
jgi:hypothetical protein